MPARAPGAALAIASLLTAGVVHAQVNIESVRSKDAPDGLSGKLEASVTGRTGNTQGLVAGGAGRVQFRSGKHVTFLVARGDYSRLNDVTQVSKAMAHLRYAYRFVPRAAGETFVQIENDKFRRITDRELFGVGPRLLVIDSLQADLYLGSAPMLERNRIQPESAGAASPDTLALRWSNYLSLELSVDDRFSVSSTTYFQPRFDRFADFRLLHETALEAKLTPLVGNKVDVLILYDSRAPEGVDRTDAQIANSIVISF